MFMPHIKLVLFLLPDSGVYQSQMYVSDPPPVCCECCLKCGVVVLLLETLPTNSEKLTHSFRVDFKR